MTPRPRLPPPRSLTVASRLRALFSRGFASLRGCPPEASL